MKIFTIISFIFVFCFNAFSQTTQQDLNLIKTTNFNNYLYNNRVIKPMQPKSKNVFVKYNPINLTFAGLLYLYQKVLSPQVFAGCMYNPTCSHFSKESIKKYGLLKGIFLTADRLNRCNKISALDIPQKLIDPKTGKVFDNPDFYKIKKR